MQSSSGQYSHDPAYRFRPVAFVLQKTHKELFGSKSHIALRKKKDIKLIIYNNRPRLVDLATVDTHRKKVSKEAIDNLEIEV